MAEVYDNDDTQETVYESVLDTLTDDQFMQYLEDGTLPHGVVLESSSDKADSEVEEPASDEADNKEEDTDIKETKEEESESEESESNTEEENESEELADSDDDSEESQQESNDEESETFKKLFSKRKIKANGTEFTLENLDEAISLIQKGVGYEAKMKKLKPSQKIIKSLEQNKISEADVNFLIDLHKGDKTAIKELLAKHNLDTMEIDEVESTYKPNSNNIITDEALKLSLNAEVIAESEYSDRIDKVIFDTWDEESKKLIASRPETLIELLEEFKLGRFDTIQAIVARENALGKNKLPDIVRYGELAKLYEESEGRGKKSEPTVKQQEAKKSAKPAAKAVAPKPAPKKKPSDYTIKEIEKMSDAQYLELFG